MSDKSIAGKHTPGPWIADRPNPKCVAECPPFWIDARGHRVADVLMQGQETTANARLIAAAPDLLEALRECITENTAHCLTVNTWQAQAMERRIRAINAIARAAIAKAQGGAA